jgi:hypothetical protein
MALVSTRSNSEQIQRKLFDRRPKEASIATAKQ